jgi:hypothetical protein
VAEKYERDATLHRVSNSLPAISLISKSWSLSLREERPEFATDSDVDVDVDAEWPLAAVIPE